MSSRRDAERWERWRRGDDCPICRSVAVDEATAELEVSRLMMSDDGPMRGYAWLAFRRHAIELHDLNEQEGAALMKDLQLASAAIAAASDAVKLNYEIHGNTVPHLHVHIFPRYPGDPFEGRPIDPRTVAEPVYGPGEFTRMHERVVEELARLGGRP
jgi:diadenosine tetraphosphate (Ap4A) HIT family hydrolase